MKTSLYILAFLLGVTITLVVMAHLRLNTITQTLRGLGHVGGHIGCWDDPAEKDPQKRHKSKHWAPETAASRSKRLKS